jgi:hypothetical protein
MHFWKKEQEQELFCQPDNYIYFDQIQIGELKARIKELENQIDLIPDVNQWNLLFNYFRKQNLEPFYESINRISQEIKTTIDSYLEVMENDNHQENNLSLSLLLEILVDVNMVMNKLNKKDVQFFMLNQEHT